jgi:hypothetical protein
VAADIAEPGDLYFQIGERRWFGGLNRKRSLTRLAKVLAAGV